MSTWRTTGEHGLLRPSANVDLRLEQLPARPLEKIEHRRVVEMPEHVAIGRIDVEGDFGQVRHDVLIVRESKVNQNNVTPRAAASSAQANAFALYVPSRSIDVTVRNCAAARRPASVSRPYAPPYESCTTVTAPARDARNRHAAESFDQLRRAVCKRANARFTPDDSRNDARADHSDVTAGNREGQREPRRCSTRAEGNDDCLGHRHRVGVDLIDELEPRVDVAEDTERRASAGGDPFGAARPFDPSPRIGFDWRAKDRRSPRGSRDAVGDHCRRRIHLLLPPSDDDVRAEPLAICRDGEGVRRSRRSDRDDAIVARDAAEKEFERADLVAADRVGAQIVTLDPKRRRQRGERTQSASENGRARRAAARRAWETV